MLAAEIIVRDQCSTPKVTDGEELFDVLAGLIDELLEQARHKRLSVQVGGVGTGGPMEPGGSAISPLNIPAWRGFPLRARLEQLPGLGAVPVFIDNDAKALALGEAWAGAGRGRAELPRHGGLDRSRWRHRARRTAPRGPHRQRGPHRPCHRRAFWPALSLRVAWVPRGRDLRSRHRGDDGPARRGGRPGDRRIAPACSSGELWRRWRACSTSAWRSSAARSRSATGRTSFSRRKESSTPPPESRTPEAAGCSPWRSGPTGPWSGPQPWGGGGSVV